MVRCGKWNVTDSGSGTPGTIAMDDAKSVSAAFVIYAPNTFSTVSASNGTVAKVPDAASYDSGKVVVLTPVAAPGYRFSGWAGDLSGTTSPGSITMTGAKNVTANFTIKPLRASIISSLE